jgi:protein-disulfide isomerase
MKRTFDIAVTTILVACALVTTGVVVHREFFGLVPSRPQSEDVFLKEWRSYLPTGVRLGLLEAPVQVVEFSDFDCPFCRTFHDDVKTLRERYPTQLALTYVHFPLPMHRFAMPAARVAECAGAQGRFEAMYDQLFDGQDSFGLKPWSYYATEAGVPDLAVFDTCIQNTGPVPRVEEGKQLGARIKVQGTPTVVINGWKLGHTPHLEDLDRMVKAILAGRSPVSEDGKNRTGG